MLGARQTHPYTPLKRGITLATPRFQYSTIEQTNSRVQLFKAIFFKNKSMKNLFSFILVFLSITGHAQTNPDSVAYQLQRQKINAMLEERTRKFGQYEQSLSEHTGIFGFQTKKDIRHSNDILMDINKTDDEIYAQVKILLQMTVFQKQQVQDRSRETEERSNQTEKYNLTFMNTINRLHTENEQLKAQLDAADRREQRIITGFVLVILLIGLSIFWLRKKNFALKR